MYDVSPVRPVDGCVFRPARLRPPRLGVDAVAAPDVATAEEVDAETGRWHQEEEGGQEQELKGVKRKSVLSPSASQGQIKSSLLCRLEFPRPCYFLIGSAWEFSAGAATLPFPLFPYFPHPFRNRPTHKTRPSAISTSSPPLLQLPRSRLAHTGCQSTRILFPPFASKGRKPGLLQDSEQQLTKMA